jgi:O-antigen/teichoic acid export membrane protein
MGPVVSTYFKSNERQKLSKIVAKSSLFSLLIGSTIFGFYVLFGDWMLDFLFNRSIPEEYEVLMITSLGYFFQVIAGSAAFLLIMDSKTSKFATISIAFGLIINTVINYFLIPKMGISGAAWGTTFSLLAWCILMIIFSIRKTKINPTCFGLSLFR